VDFDLGLERAGWQCVGQCESGQKLVLLSVKDNSAFFHKFVADFFELKMDAFVFNTSTNQEIFYSVIIFDSIDMVNYLVRLQSPFCVSLGNQDMLRNIFVVASTWSVDHDVSPSVNKSPAVPRWMVLTSEYRPARQWSAPCLAAVVLERLIVRSNRFGDRSKAFAVSQSLLDFIYSNRSFCHTGIIQINLPCNN